MHKSLNLSDYHMDGFTYGYDYNIIELIGDLPPLSEWVDECHGIRYPENIDLSLSMDYIASTYLSPMLGDKFDKVYDYIWDKSEPQTMLWHNDLIEGANVFFLYYLTDVTQGGEICFRVNGGNEKCLQPKRGLLVMGSQAEHIEHKANFTQDLRITSNYGFNI